MKLRYGCSDVIREKIEIVLVFYMYTLKIRKSNMVGKALGMKISVGLSKKKKKNVTQMKVLYVMVSLIRYVGKGDGTE